MDAYTLAKAYFDVKEYDRAAHFLHGCNSKKAYFLYMYSRYLVRATLRCFLLSGAMCELGFEPGSSGETASALHH